MCRKYEAIFHSDAVQTLGLPDLSKVLAFPTTILINRKGNVQKIHTGYTGAATGKYYKKYVREFNEDIERLLRNQPLSVTAQRSGK